MDNKNLNRLASCIAVLGALVISCSDGSSPQGQGSGGSQAGGNTGTTGAGGASVPNGSGGSLPATGGKGGGGAPGSGGTIVGTGGKGSGGAPGSGGAVPGTGGKGSGGSIPAAGGNAPDGGLGSGGMVVGSGGRASGGATGAGGSAPIDGGTAGSTGLAGPAVPSDGCGKATTAKTGNNQTISVGGSSRTYNLFVPTNYDNSHPYRLIVSYHWLNGTAANVSDGSGTAAAWYGQNTSTTGGGSTIFVAPQGLNNGWSNSGGADVTFSRTLITQLESQLCVDKARIFCEGFSMGGSMSYAMASAAPDIIRAVAVHSGGSMSGSTNGHNKPVAYFMTHGTKDSVCTWPGYGLPQLQDFAKVNGCKTPDPSSSASAFQALLPQPTSNKGVCLDFTGCTDGYPTRSCLFVGDHTPSPDGTTGWVPKETWLFFSKF